MPGCSEADLAGADQEVYRREELYKLGWSSAFYGCSRSDIAAEDRQLQEDERLLYEKGFRDGIVHRLGGYAHGGVTRRYGEEIVPIVNNSGEAQLLNRLDIIAYRLRQRIPVINAMMRRRVSEDNAGIGSSIEERIRRELQIIEEVLDSSHLQPACVKTLESVPGKVGRFCRSDCEAHDPIELPDYWGPVALQIGSTPFKHPG